MGKASRKRLDAEARRELLSRFSASGLSVAAFCRQAGVSKATFYRWRGLLGRADERDLPCDSGAGFVDLGTLKPARLSDKAPLSDGRLELKLDLGGGLILHLVRG
ncbi:MAG: transposase [Sulfuricella sp.]|jgi:transposase-like protein|nr:transposase [Sulfuricella sp.]